MVIVCTVYQFNRMALGIGAWLLNPHRYLFDQLKSIFNGCDPSTTSDQSLFLVWCATSISVKVRMHSPVLGKHMLSWYRAGSLIKVPFNHCLLFEQPLGCQGLALILLAVLV